MKRILKSQPEPNELSSYIATRPCSHNKHTWDAFKKHKVKKVAVQKKLRNDQKGLCAYCEIDMLEVSSAVQNSNCSTQPVIVSDFRVDHFHPKSDNLPQPNYWELRWDNLFACCMGGSARYVVDSQRFTVDHLERTCDVPKDSRILDSIVLNPMQIPAFPSLFSYNNSDGRLEVATVNCQSAGVNATIAQNSIDEFHLNSKRLRDFRREAIKGVNTAIRKEVQLVATQRVDTNFVDSLDISAWQTIFKTIAKQFFVSGSDWPPFFTAIRSYLGQAAEEQLQAINYDG